MLAKYYNWHLFASNIFKGSHFRIKATTHYNKVVYNNQSNVFISEKWGDLKLADCAALSVSTVT